MLIVGIENPHGETHYVAAAFPSACGKTNLAMLIPPEGYRNAGWKIWTVGDDICWMTPGEDGRLWAINPEAGYFGVAPGTSAKTNPNALAMLGHDAIFTNVAVTEDMQPWWEGLTEGTPVEDWQGREHDPGNGPAAHPNSRFTVSASQCPSWSPEAEAAQGVPISAIVFGGRRQSLVPLVFEARDWTHGVLVGAAMASETTAAATGQVGVVRRDPMAMKPFCGYNYRRLLRALAVLRHARRASCRRSSTSTGSARTTPGKFLWPGFGENMRVLEWMLKRVTGQADGRETPIGILPAEGELNLDGLGLDEATREALFAVDREDWQTEMEAIGEYLDDYGERMPEALKAEQRRVAEALAGEDGRGAHHNAQGRRLLTARIAAAHGGDANPDRPRGIKAGTMNASCLAQPARMPAAIAPESARRRPGACRRGRRHRSLRDAVSAPPAARARRRAATVRP